MLDDFNPRSPCGERRQRSYSSLAPRLISIHAPRAGSDVRLYRDDGGKVTFQSTLPVRGATNPLSILISHFWISIHAPRAGSDVLRIIPFLASSAFQSTLPVRGATVVISVSRAPNEFQSTLPVRGATRSGRISMQTKSYFNPRSPCGERLLFLQITAILSGISIHAPRAGSD